VVAVNLSPADFHSGTLITTIRRALQRHALPAYRLEVEITEGTLMTDSELVLGQLRILRDMGVAKMKLLGSPRRMPSMVGYGLEVTGFIAADASQGTD
jgi:hypothetical protein